MRYTWLAAVAVAAILVAGIVFFASGRSRRVPEPAPAARPAARPTRLAAKRVAEPIAADCAPLAAGGYSCGACRNDEDCPEKSACVLSLETGRTECRASDCAKNQECEKGHYCRVITRTPGGTAVRSCVAPGIRRAGAACDPDNASDPSVSCAGNLVCINGGCSPPCEPTPIPEDSEECTYLGCIGTDNGYGCTPSCKHYPCEGGKTCSFLSTEGPISLCTYAVGKNCLGPDGGCTATQECIVETNAREERTTFQCAERCTLDNADGVCPRDFACVLQNAQGEQGGHCRRRCSQDGEPVCGSGERCKRDDLGVWYCSAA